MSQIQAQQGVSILRDMGHATWVGCRLRPGVDITFWVEKLPGDRSCRNISARLVRPAETPVVANWINQQRFDLTALGNDYLNLESEVAEMMVIARHVTDITITADAEGPGVTLTLTLPGGDQRFELNVGIVGRWDWFINPREAAASLVQLEAAVA